MAEDPEGGAVTFLLLTQPEQGTVTLDDPATGSFTYTPGRRTGRFSFTYLAVDEYGGRSGPASVHITVEKKAASTVIGTLAV